MRECTKCNQLLDEMFFPKYRPGHGTNICKKCKYLHDNFVRKNRGEIYLQQKREINKRYREKNKEKIKIKEKERRKRRFKQQPILKLWKHMEQKKDKLNITKKDFLENYTIPDICPILGIPLSHSSSRENLPSVNRINSQLPYQLGNIAIISLKANIIKNYGSAEDHLKIYNWMIANTTTTT